MSRTLASRRLCRPCGSRAELKTADADFEQLVAAPPSEIYTLERIAGFE